MDSFLFDLPKTQNEIIQITKRSGAINGVVTEEVRNIVSKIIIDNIPFHLQPVNWSKIIQPYKEKRYAQINNEVIMVDGNLKFLENGIMSDFIKLLQYFPKLPCSLDLAKIHNFYKCPHTNRVMLTFLPSETEEITIDIYGNIFYEKIQMNHFGAIVNYYNKETRQFIRIEPFEKKYESGYTKSFLNSFINELHSFNDYPSQITMHTTVWHRNGLEHRDNDKCSSIHFQCSTTNEPFAKINYKISGVYYRMNGLPSSICWMCNFKTKSISTVKYEYSWRYIANHTTKTIDLSLNLIVFPMLRQMYPHSSFIRMENGKRKLVCCIPSLVCFFNNEHFSEQMFTLCLLPCPSEIIVLILHFLHPQCPQTILSQLVSLMLQSIYSFKSTKKQLSV
jgi:hypothetical protein